VRKTEKIDKKTEAGREKKKKKRKSRKMK